MAVLSTIAVRLPYLGVIVLPAEAPVESPRAARRAHSKRDKARHGDGGWHTTRRAWARCGDNVDWKSIDKYGDIVHRDDVMPEPVKIAPAVELESYSTAVVDDAALEARIEFDVLAVERDRSRFAIGLWGIRRFVS